jgi:peptidoglycan/xylan/chitin deacetylase (PgdA/CDA1 family)
MYHSIGDRLDSSVPVKQFERHLQILTTNYRLQTLREWHESSTEPSSQPTACITFDDGYLDNYEQALRVLEKYDIPATFFITTELMGSRFSTSSGESPMMNSNHIQKLADKGHEIGGHSASHTRLNNLSSKRARSEIINCTETLRNELNLEVDSFAYPKGSRNSQIIQVLNELDYQRAVTTAERLAGDRDGEFELPRIWIHKRLPEAIFRSKLTGAQQTWNRVRSWFRSSD